MRELHWHPNADEWQYYIKGKARMTVFNTGPKAQTADFNPGDIGVVKKDLGHYEQNTGTEDLVFMEIFKDAHYKEISLAQWLAEPLPICWPRTSTGPQAPAALPHPTGGRARLIVNLDGQDRCRSIEFSVRPNRRIARG